MPRSRREKKDRRWTFEDEAVALKEIQEEDAKRSNIVERMNHQREKELELEKKRYHEELVRQTRERFLYGERKEIEDLFKARIVEHEQKIADQAPKTVKDIAVAKEALRVREADAIKSQHGYNIIYNKIFKGSYWKTLQARRKEDPNTMIALTVIDLKACPKEKKDNLTNNGFRISRWLSQHHHDTLVHVYDIFLHNTDYFIFHEQMAYFLERFMRHGQPATEYRAQAWGRDLADGIGYLHANGIVHRNICPQTVWLTFNLRVKLGNFSFASIYYDTKNSRRIPLTKIHIKEAEYHPPEESNSAAYDATKSDVWMWAATVVFMLTKKFPPKTGFESFQDPSFKSVSDDGMRLLNLCLNKENTARPSIPQVSHDLWFKSLIETPMIKFTPTAQPMEGTVDQSEQHTGEHEDRESSQGTTVDSSEDASQ